MLYFYENISTLLLFYRYDNFCMFLLPHAYGINESYSLIKLSLEYEQKMWSNLLFSSTNVDTIVKSYKEIV